MSLQAVAACSDLPIRSRRVKIFCSDFSGFRFPPPTGSAFYHNLFDLFEAVSAHLGWRTMSLPNFPRLAVSVQDTCRWAEQSDLFGSSVHCDKRAIESCYSFCRQDRRMHVLKWVAQNVPNRSKECCAVLAMLCEEFEKACCGLYRAHSSSDLLTTSPTRLLRQPMMRRQGMDNYPVPTPLATHF